MNTENRQDIAEPEYSNIYYCQWLDIQNRAAFITLSKEREFISDTISFANSKNGKLYVYIFSAGIVDDEFNENYNGMKEDFEKRNINTHNYSIGHNIAPHEIIPIFEQHKKELSDNSDLKETVKTN